MKKQDAVHLICDVHGRQRLSYFIKMGFVLECGCAFHKIGDTLERGLSFHATSPDFQINRKLHGKRIRNGA